MILVEGAVNAAIMLLKAVTGVLTGSMAILSDALHSLTDLANNGVALGVLHWSARPPDEDHPYGHRKFETIAVFLLAMLLSVTAFQVALRAIGREGGVVGSPPWSLAVMLGVLGTNVVLASWQGWWARRLQSDLLQADARHTVADSLTTVVTIVGWQAASRGYLWLDTAASLCVAVLIGTLAFGLFQRSLPILVDQTSIPPEELREVAATVAGVLGVGGVRSRSYGRWAAVDLVVRVDGDLGTVASHEIATEVEHAIRRALPVESVTVHIEPGSAGEKEEVA